MKKVTLAASLVFALTAGLASVSAHAAQKIGVIDVQAVFQQLPQAAMIESAIRTEFKDEVAEVKRLENDIKFNLEKQKREGATLSESEKEELVKQTLALREEYAAKAQPLDQKVRARTTEERNKILALIKQTVDIVAAEEKYDIILQANTVAYLASEDDNISSKVIEKVSKAQ